MFCLEKCSYLQTSQSFGVILVISASWNIFIQNILTVKNWNSLCFWYKYIIYRSSNFSSTFHLIYYLCSMWHTQNFVNYITICRLLMLKRKRGLCLRHFIAWVIRVLHTFLQVSWFFFFFKARRWAELICGLYLTYFSRSKFGIKILKRRRKKNSREKPPNWHPYPDSFCLAC